MTLTTLDAARGLQRKHSKLMRDIDRVRSILPSDFTAAAFIPAVRIDAEGRRQRFFRLTRDGLLFLFMGEATKHEIRWMAEAVRRLHRTCFSDDE